MNLVITMLIIVPVCLLGGWRFLEAKTASPLPRLMMEEAQLLVDRKHLADLEKELARLREDIEEQAAEIRALQVSLREKQKELAKWLDWVYRQGATPFLTYLLGSDSLCDLAARSTLLSYLMDHGLTQIRETEAELATLQERKAALEKQESIIRAAKDDAAATIARVRTLEDAEKAALSQADAGVVAGGQAQEKTNGAGGDWRRSLPCLAYLVTHLDRLPWQNLKAEDVRIDFRHLAVEASIPEETLQRILTADPVLASVTVRSQPGAVVVGGPGFVLTGRPEVQGDRVIFMPQGLQLADPAVSNKVLQDLLAGPDLFLPFASPYPGLRLLDVQAEQGRLVLHLSLANF